MSPASGARRRLRSSGTPKYSSRLPVKSWIGEISSKTSRIPSSTNQRKDLRWTSTRSGSSRTSGSFPKLTRSRRPRFTTRPMPRRGVRSKLNGPVTNCFFSSADAFVAVTPISSAVSRRSLSQRYEVGSLARGGLDPPEDRWHDLRGPRPVPPIAGFVDRLLDAAAPASRVPASGAGRTRTSRPPTGAGEENSGRPDPGGVFGRPTNEFSTCVRLQQATDTQRRGKGSIRCSSL